MKNSSQENFKNYIDIEHTICSLLTNLEFGKGIFLESKDSELLKIWKNINSNNNINNLIWKLLFQKNKNGNSIIKFDIANEKYQLQLADDITDFAVSKIYNEIIALTITHSPIKTKGKTNLDLKIREIWSEKEIWFTFMYQKNSLPTHEWILKIPEEYQNFNLAFVNNAKFDKHKNHYVIKNQKEMIPVVLFETPTGEKTVKEADNFNNLINSAFHEIYNDIAYSRPITFGIANEKVQDYYKNNGRTPPIALNPQAYSPENVDKIQNLAPKERLSVLAQTIEHLIRLAFTSANVSYIKQLASVPSNANDLANSAGARHSDVCRQISNYNLHLFFTKLFQIAGIKKPDFKIKLLENDETEMNLKIEALAKKMALDLISEKEALAEINPNDESQNFNQNENKNIKSKAENFIKNENKSAN